MSILTTVTGGIYKWIAMAGIGLGLAVGGFFYGRHVGAEVSKVAISNYENKVTTQDNEINSLLTPEAIHIATEYTTKVVHIKDTGKTNDQIITNTVTDKQFLSHGWVSDYNASITGNAIDPTTSANGASSGLTAAAALTGIADNNTTCLNYKEELSGLQAYINGYNAAVNKVNATNKKK